MHQPRIGGDGQHVGQEIEQDIGRGEDQGAGLDHGDVAHGHGIDQQLPETGIDEHHLDDDHPDHQIGEVEHDHVDDRRQGVGQGVLDDDVTMRDIPVVQANAMNFGGAKRGAARSR